MITCRPSDALALVLRQRMPTPVLVADWVFDPEDPEIPGDPAPVDAGQVEPGPVEPGPVESVEGDGPVTPAI